MTSGQPPGRERASAVLTISGGAGVLLADRCEAAGLELAAAVGGDGGGAARGAAAVRSLRNPVDLTAQVFNEEEGLQRVVAAVLGDPGVDQVIVYCASIQGAMAERLAGALVAAAAGSDKPMHVGWSAPPRSAPSPRWSARGGPDPVSIPTPGRAAHAAGALRAFAQQGRARRRRPAGAPRGAVPAGDRRRRGAGWASTARSAACRLRRTRRGGGAADARVRRVAGGAAAPVPRRRQGRVGRSAAQVRRRRGPPRRDEPGRAEGGGA